MTIYLVCERGFTSPVSSNIFKYRLTVRSDTLCSWPISCGEACQARTIQIIRHRKSREYGIGMTKARRRCFCCLDLPRHIIWVKVQAIVRMRIRYWTTNLKIPVCSKRVRQIEIRIPYLHSTFGGNGASLHVGHGSFANHQVMLRFLLGTGRMPHPVGGAMGVTLSHRRENPL